MEDFKQMQVAVVARLRKALCKPAVTPVVEPEATPEVTLEVEPVMEPEVERVEKPYAMPHDRRSFLKVFGVGQAVVVTALGDHEVINNGSKDYKDYDPPNPQSGAEELWESKREMHSTVSQVLYDRVDVPRCGMKDRYNFFNQAMTSDRGPEYTNLWSPCRLDAPELYKMSALGVTFDPTTTPEVRSLVIRNYSLDFWIGQRYFCRVPLVEAFGQGSDPTCDFKTLYHLDIPLIWSWEHSFHMTLQSSNAPKVNTKFTMWGVLHGQKARGIQ